MQSQKKKSKKETRFLVETWFLDLVAVTVAATAAPSAASTPPAATATPAAAAFRAWPGLVDVQSATLQGFSVHAAYRVLSLSAGGHFHKAKPAGFTTGAVLDDGGRLDLAEGRESLAQIGLGRIRRQVANIDVHANS
jgi:hypothetical protein